jgi:energy-coupling factor transport system permease protein
MDVRVKIIVSFSLSLLVVLIDALIPLLSLSLVGVSLFLLTRPNRTQIKLALLTAIPLVWGIMISQGMFYQRLPRQVLVRIIEPGWFFEEGVNLYVQGILYGGIQSLRLLTMMFTGYAICFSTSPESFLKGLVTLRIPFSLSFMISSSIRFIPIALSEFQAVRAAMRMKGYRPFRGGVINTVKTEMSALRPVLAATIRRSEDIALSVLTRGFSFERKRTSLHQPRLTTWNWLLFSLLALLISLILTLKLLFWLYQHEIFYSSSLRVMYAFSRNWL